MLGFSLSTSSKGLKKKKKFKVIILISNDLKLKSDRF